jgi:hypothetical protein
VREADPDFHSHYEALLERLAPGSRGGPAPSGRVLHLPAAVPPWTATGLVVSAGDEVTLLARGRVTLSEELGLWGGPRVYLWARVGGRGPLLHGTRETATFRAPRDGELEVAVCAGDWADREGTPSTPPEAQAQLRGGFDVVAILWPGGEAAAGLRALLAAAPGDPLLAAEVRRSAEGVAPPPGWSYHWRLGPAEVFEAGREEGRDVIRVHADDDVGILCRPVDHPLGAETTLAWRWRVGRLPATTAEDALPAHDYVSIALEFDDGRDLTWYWSAALPVGTAYPCPIPSWRAQETHLVVRSGPAGLGAWHAEARPVRADWERAVGGRAPGHIVAVWLIAVSVFRHGIAEAAFADIELREGGRCLRIAGGGTP